MGSLHEVCPRCEGIKTYNGKACALCMGEGTMEVAVGNCPASVFEDDDINKEVSRSNTSTSPEMQEARDAMDAWIETNNLEAVVSGFSQALLDKLVAAEKKYGYRGAWKKDDWRGDLINQLASHIDKGDPLDVAAYCAFAWHHKWMLQSRFKWQPISTAPKDCMFLGFIPSDYGVEVVWFGRSGKWCCFRGDDVRPTHWMPLPTPPVTEASASVHKEKS